MKFTRLLLPLFVILTTTACTDMVAVKQTEVAFELDDDGTWKDRMYSGENIFISSTCFKHCNDAHVWESQHVTTTIESEYAMPKSNDMDLTLGLNLKVTLNKTGGAQAIRERLMAAAKRYPYSVQGDAYGDNQVFRTQLQTIINIDLNKAQVKSKLRPILEPFELGTAYYNISKGGSIVQDAQKALEKHLADIDSPLQLLSVQVERVSQPQELLDKKKKEEGLTSQEKIHLRELDMMERRMAREQLIALKAASNELELLDINSQFMTPEILAYKWIQTAQMFAEKGLPFATTPEMLLPSISKLTDMSIDTSKAKARLKERIESVESELKQEADCAEGNCE